MPVFPSIDWFDAVRHEFNTDESVRTAGGGTCDAKVGLRIGEELFLLVFEGFECSSAAEIAEPELEATDFYLDMPVSDWEEMLTNIVENGKADLDHTLNTLDLDTEEGLARSYTGDQYLQDLFYRYNQTFQNFFDLASRVETVFRDMGDGSES